MDDHIFFACGECCPCYNTAAAQVTVLRGSMGPRGATGATEQVT